MANGQKQKKAPVVRFTFGSKVIEGRRRQKWMAAAEGAFTPEQVRQMAAQFETLKAEGLMRRCHAVVHEKSHGSFCMEGTMWGRSVKAQLDFDGTKVSAPVCKGTINGEAVVDERYFLHGLLRLTRACNDLADHYESEGRVKATVHRLHPPEARV